MPLIMNETSPNRGAANSYQNTIILSESFTRIRLFCQTVNRGTGAMAALVPLTR